VARQLRSSTSARRRRSAGPRVRRALILGLATLAPLGLTACGSGGVSHAGSAADASQGKQLFTQKCGSCHTLADAGAQGQIGPNLDAAFGPGRSQGFKASTIREIVRDQIKYPGKGTGMPANLVTGDDRESVAAYVAQCAGNTDPTLCKGAGTSGGGGGTSGGGGTDGKTIFTSNCASCHTLSDAKATGNIGPNLDQLKPGLARVQKQVIHGGGAMPAFKGKLSDKQIKAVAKYVSSVAGK
jgi:mono/diheme cytochrome c family protein